MTSVTILLLAVALDLVLGDPPNALHPTAWMGQFIGWCAARAPQRGAAAQFVYGALLVLFGILLFILPIHLGLASLRAWNEIAFVVASAVIMKTTFTLRGLVRAARAVQAALVAGDLPEARRRVAWHLVSRDTRALDQVHVVSATIESVAENLADSFVAPLFFYALFGVPGALAYRFVNTADAMIGYHGKTEYLGKAAARLDDLLNLVPARVSGLLIVIGAICARADARGAWRVLWRDHARTGSPNAGYPMSAMAGALGVQLEKIGHYCLGDATHTLTPTLISRALWVMGAAAGLWLLGLTLLLFTVY